MEWFVLTVFYFTAQGDQRMMEERVYGQQQCMRTGIDLEKRVSEIKGQKVILNWSCVPEKELSAIEEEVCPW